MPVVEELDLTSVYTVYRYFELVVWFAMSGYNKLSVYKAAVSIS